MNFKNNNILITGGSRGIGRATALRFAEMGANVIINYRQDEEAANSCLREMGKGRHSAYKADIADDAQVQEMVEALMEEYERIDVLVNNAGIYSTHAIEEMGFEEWRSEWRQTIQTNLMGMAHLTFLVAKGMMERKEGAIVNVSSRGAFRGEPDSPAYGASKAAVNSFSQSMAKKLGAYNISVTAVAPGFVETDMGMSVLKERGEEIRSQSPFGRVAQPEEVARTITFLASPESQFLSGGIVDINGASYLRM